MPPVIAIEIPENGSTIHGGFPVSLQAFIFDDGRGAPTVQWTSSINGNLGTGFSTTYDGLAYGVHTITAVATFPDSSDIQDAVTLTVVNDPPNVEITSPIASANFLQGQPVLLAATSTDINEPTGHLADAQVSWYVDGLFIGNNHTRTIAAGILSVGLHEIRIEGTDGLLSKSQTVKITTNPNPPDLPPDQVNITNPTQGATLLYVNDATGWHSELTLEGNAHDPEDGALTGTALSWTISRNGAAAVPFGTGASLAVKLYPEGESTQDITLTATDSAANSSSVTIRVFQPIIILK
jgi:hypothetical protein